jgi:hypothetical protein
MPIDKSWTGYAKGTIPNDGFEWIWQDAIPADEPNRDPPVTYIPFGYEKKVLPRGWQKTTRNKPLDLDIIFEKDVEIGMRDGVKASLASESQFGIVDPVKYQVLTDIESTDLRRYLPPSRCRWQW